jgi:hypothetical protein
MADNSKRIAQIEELLRTGVTQVTVDGTTTIVDPDSLRAELRKLQNSDDSTRGKRPVVSRIRLGGFQ